MLNVGLELGIISPAVCHDGALMALPVTTLVTAPVLAALLKPPRNARRSRLGAA
mgnify:CR=1 FL=1